MYVAIYKIDSGQRHILVGWSDYNNQIPHTAASTGTGHLYSAYVTEHITPVNAGITYELTAEGPVGLTTDKTESTLLELSKISKTTLINQQVEKMTDQVAPASYLLYLYGASIYTEVQTYTLFNWLTRVNMVRDERLRQVQQATTVADVNSISSNFGEIELERPLMPVVSPPYTDYIFTRSAISTFARMVNVEAKSETELHLKTAKTPISGHILVRSQMNEGGYWTNHTEQVKKINPVSIFFRMADDTVLSAYAALSESTPVPVGCKQIEFSVSPKIRLTSLTLSLSGEDTATVITTCNSQTDRGKNLLFSLECTSENNKITTDSSHIGPISIQGSELGTAVMTKQATLRGGLLSVDINHMTPYEVVDMNGGVLFRGTESATGMVVPADSVLKCNMPASTTTTAFSWALEVEDAITESYPIRLKYIQDQDKLIIVNDHELDLEGELILYHKAQMIETL